MDLSVFAKEHFSAKEWVNNTFRQSEANSQPENVASSIVMKLQLAIFEINSSLENTSTMVIQNLPRLLRDIELLQNEVVHFQKKLAAVEHEVSKVEGETTHSLEYIVKLDEVKKKLKATSKALQEADNWTTLMADVEELFESNDLMAISKHINSLRQSLDLLNHVSDYNERMMQLDGLRNRLEALASPHLVTAISAGDINKTTTMVQVFTNMDRLDQLLHYYTKCRRGAMLQQWKELNESDMNIIEIINRYYEILLADLQEQTKWYLNVFNQNLASSCRIILPIYTQALSALDPSPLHSMESLIKKPAAIEGLFMLQQIKSSADRLLLGVETHFKEMGQIETDILRQFSESLFQVFRLMISNKYKSLCLQHFVEQFPTTVEESNETSESIHRLRQSHSKISSLMDSTLSNCITLTQGYGLEMLTETWNRFLVSHLHQYKNVLQKIQNLMMPFGSEDSLHTALSLLQTLGELLILLEDKELVFSEHIKDMAKKQNQAQSSQMCIKTLYLEAQPLQRLEVFLKGQDLSMRQSYLSSAVDVAKDLSSEIQRCIYDTLLNPIHQQISLLGTQEWADIISGSGLTEDLPDFGLAPMEYITQIGQYLMMLPQHLEPFVLQENRGLSRALLDTTVPQGKSIETSNSSANQMPSATDCLLGSVALTAANALTDAILRIENVGPKGAKQLAADINYLGNIFEDLGLVLPASLVELVELFRAAASAVLANDIAGFKTASQGKNPRLVAAVRSITNLPSSD